MGGKNKDYREEQIRVFERHINIALEKQLPLVLHVRDATDDGKDILRRKVPRTWKGHLHSCHDLELVKLVLEEFPNFYIGITGTITMEPFGEEISALLPVSRMVLETDGPFLLPEGGLFNHVGQIPFIARIVARLAKCEVDHLLSTCRANTRFVYGI